MKREGRQRIVKRECGHEGVKREGSAMACSWQLGSAYISCCATTPTMGSALSVPPSAATWAVLVARAAVSMLQRASMDLRAASWRRPSA